MGEKRNSGWYRVVDPLNPLCGCDVRVPRVFIENDLKMAVVDAVRRVDIFVGDRPFQLFAPEGQSLGVWVNVKHLAASPIQDEVVETGADRPYGICIDESEMTRADGVTLRVARYERATQVARENADGQLLSTATKTDELRNFWEELIVNMFSRGDDQDDITYALRNN